jgi:AcrR family transcriptional regulator
MARGLTEVSMPAIAREAGVSIRTVYRHFPTKADLIDALAGHVFGREELERMPPPAALEDLEPTLRGLFRRISAIDPMVRAALATQAGWEARRASIPTRLGLLRSGLKTTRPGLDDVTVEHLARLALILTSSFSVQAWKDYLGLDADEAAAEVTWVLRAVLAGAERAA